MLAIEVIVNRFAEIIRQEIPECVDRIYLNRTQPLSYERGEVPAANISQGDDTPSTELCDWESQGWLADISIDFTAAGDNEQSVVRQLNDFRLRTTKAIVRDSRIGLAALGDGTAFVLEVIPSTARALLTDNSVPSVFVKELDTIWRVAYRVRRDNPEIT